MVPLELTELIEDFEAFMKSTAANLNALKTRIRDLELQITELHSRMGD